jgi:hypothetical protein
MSEEIRTYALTNVADDRAYESSRLSALEFATFTTASNRVARTVKQPNAAGIRRPAWTYRFSPSTCPWCKLVKNGDSSQETDHHAFVHHLSPFFTIHHYSSPFLLQRAAKTVNAILPLHHPSPFCATSLTARCSTLVRPNACDTKRELLVFLCGSAALRLCASALSFRESHEIVTLFGGR